MKFSAIIKGAADVRPVDLALPGLAEPIKVGVRPLSAWEEADVLEKARAFATARGLAAPSQNDELYVFGVWVHTLLLGCAALDGDDKGQPFFASAEEILKGLDRDRISYLFEQQQRVQEEHGMRKERLTPDEIMRNVHECATKDVGDPSLPFWNWGPSARASYFRFTAALLLSYMSDKSPRGSTFEADSEADTRRSDA